ncbi:MAG: glycosyltransferase [Pirellulales bacterium]
MKCGFQDEPVFPEVGIIALVNDRWETGWRSRHQVLSRLACYFPVVWMNPSLDRTEFTPQAILHRISREKYNRFVPNLDGYDAIPWLPKFHKPKQFANWLTKERLLRARRMLERRGCKRVILYIWDPSYSLTLNLIKHDLSCYHIVDEYSFSVEEQPLTAVEFELIQRVDQVFIHSPALVQKKGHINPATKVIPNGVDFEAFSQPTKEPADMELIPHPRIGYVGLIKMQLDLDLLIKLSDRHPHWSFVFAGPQGNVGDRACLVDELSRHPNVYFLGSKEIESLPAYIQHMDVCMLCYKDNDYTKYIYPLKLHEYLAAGQPVVGTPICTLRDFKHVIRLARTVDDWSTAICESLEKNESNDILELRRNVARQHDWYVLVRQIAHALCVHLGSDYVTRLSTIKDYPVTTNKQEAGLTLPGCELDT